MRSLVRVQQSPPQNPETVEVSGFLRSYRNCFVTCLTACVSDEKTRRHAVKLGKRDNSLHYCLRIWTGRLTKFDKKDGGTSQYRHWFLFRQTGISLVQNVVITDNTSIYSRWYYTGLIKPFVQNVSKVSVEPLCSTIFPSTTLSMSTPVISKTLLVGVIPRKSPLWVPRMINSEIT